MNTEEVASFGLGGGMKSSQTGPVKLVLNRSEFVVRII